VNTDVQKLTDQGFMSSERKGRCRAKNAAKEAAPCTVQFYDHNSYAGHLHTFVFDSENKFDSKNKNGWTSKTGYLNLPESPVEGTGYYDNEPFTTTKTTTSSKDPSTYWQKDFRSDYDGKGKDFSWTNVGQKVNSVTLSGSCYGIILWDYTQIKKTTTTENALTLFGSSPDLEYHIQNGVGRITDMAAPGTMSGVETNVNKCKAAALAAGLVMQLPDPKFKQPKTVRTLWGS
jgi:hypothetical protein